MEEREGPRLGYQFFNAHFRDVFASRQFYSYIKTPLLRSEEERKKEGKKSLIGFFVRKIRIQTIGLQLEPSKSIRSFPPIYIYIRNGSRLFFSSSLAVSLLEEKTSPFHSTSRVRRGSI